jgi:hypothetical protein
MPASVTAVRAFLVADAQDHPLPSPQPIDLATDVIPYGARVRLEVDVEASGPVHPLRAMMTGPGVQTVVWLWSLDGGMRFSEEVRVPIDFVGGERPGVTASFRFPIPEWQPTGHLPPPGGKCLLQICPIPVGTKPDWPFAALPPFDGPLPTFQAHFQVGEPPSPGGAAPRIVAVEGGPDGGRVRIGEPWRVTARVQDADDDLLGVFFCAVRGGLALWSSCGVAGTGVAGEVSCSPLRLGGDKWDRWGLWGDVEDSIVFFLQAVDLRGNWSEPAVMKYTLRRDVTPLWMDEPAADGPNIIAAGASREQGMFDHPWLWAQCDRTDARVCARILTQPERVNWLWGSDWVPGGAACSVALPRSRYVEVVFYAVPETGPKTIGAKMAATCPPLV